MQFFHHDKLQYFIYMCVIIRMRPFVEASQIHVFKVYIHIHTHTHTYICIYIPIHTYAMHIHIHIYTQTHTHIHTHIHVSKQARHISEHTYHTKIRTQIICDINTKYKFSSHITIQYYQQYHR